MGWVFVKTPTEDSRLRHVFNLLVTIFKMFLAMYWIRQFVSFLLPLQVREGVCVCVLDGKSKDLCVCLILPSQRKKTCGPSNQVRVTLQLPPH